VPEVGLHRVRWALVLAFLPASLAKAQSSDTLSLRIAPMELITDSSSPTPASHQSAEEKVDQPVRVIYCPEPAYPTALGNYGFGGHVILRFVVDTLGLAELEDLVVFEASNIGFIETSRRAIAKCRYRPARKAGKPVRLLVEQRILFHNQELEPSH
jgi:outer membrane biosynthesis protein TonB